MLYCVKPIYLNNIYLILCILALLFLILFWYFRKLKKNCNSNTNNIYSICQGVFVIAFSLLLIMLIVSMIDNIYCVYSYKQANYGIIEGYIEDFEYTYPNNSKVPDGIKFSIGDEKFIVRQGILNTGYNVKYNIINNNGQHLRIYYLQNETGIAVDKILRIDSY